MILNEIKKFLFFPLCICSDSPACVTVPNHGSEFPRHFGVDRTRETRKTGILHFTK